MSISIARRTVELVAAAALVWAPLAVAYEIDLHYHVKFKVAVADSWSWDESRTIASTDYGVDENKETVAAIEINTVTKTLSQAPKNYAFHCFSQKADAANSERDQRNDDVQDAMKKLEDKANAAIDAAKASGSKADTTKALIAIGVYLHCQEDSWSHNGFGGTADGHATESLKGRDKNPDHPAVRPSKTVNALRESLAKLSAFQKRLHDRTTDITNDDMAQLLAALTHSGTKEMLDAQRQRCNQELAEHWLYLVLKQKGKLAKVPASSIESYEPARTRYKNGANCKDVHDAVFTGAHEEKIVRDPTPVYPKLDVGGLPVRVRDDGSYEKVGDRSFDLRMDILRITQTVATSGTAGVCRFDMLAQASNAGPDTALPAQISVAILPLDPAVAGFGEALALPALPAGASQTLAASLPGLCLASFGAVADVQPPAGHDFGVQPWFDHNIANDTLSQVVPPRTELACDVNGDGAIDVLDINAIIAARNRPASSATDARDADGDGWIRIEDARQCTLLCTQARCLR